MSRLQDVILRDVFASRPAASIAGRLFYATDTLHWYRDNGTSWDLQDSNAGGGGGLLAANNLSDVSSVVNALANLSGAPNSAKFLTAQAEPLLTGEVNLGALASGILKQNVIGGVASISTAVSSVDYFAPGYSGQLDTISSLSPGNANILSSVSGVWAARTPAQIALNLAGTSISSLAAGNDSRFRTITFRSVSGTTDTLLLTDAGNGVEYTSGSAVTVTVPAQASVAWEPGTVCEINQYGAGKVTLVGAAGVTLRSDGAKLSTAGQYGTIGMRYRGNNEWIISGDTTT